MSIAVLLPGATSVLALLFALALADQWRDRRHGYQAVWAIGMLFYGVASGCEAVAGSGGGGAAGMSDEIATGDRFGLMKFGSRMDVFVDVDARLLVKAGDAVRAGETRLAEFPATESARC